MKIWISDLAYSKTTQSVDAFPLGAGTLATYLTAKLQVATGLDIEIFRDPDELRNRLLDDAPDVLGVSNYMWNYRLSLEFARFAKSLHPDIVTVMGGPNFPLDQTSQLARFRDDMPSIDVYVLGNTYEGEVALTECLQRFVDNGRDALHDSIPGCLTRGNETDTVHRGAPVARLRNLDDIPSPYLSGFMDKFFQTGLFPKIQLVRGCPFGCTFCNSAVKSNNKAYRHSFERITEELDYIADRIDHTTALAIADDNFGMYREDEAVADYLGALIARYDWPKMLRTTTGKNNPERILRVQEKVHGRLSMTASVQSMDEGVLATIERSNIRVDVYEEIQKRTHKRGYDSYADLIIGLPGETLESLEVGAKKLLDLGVLALSASQLLLLPGSILATPAERKKHGFETRFRLVANCIGDFGTGRIVAETEEVTYATPTLSFEDYISFREYHLVIQIFWAERMFEEAFKLAAAYNIGTRQLVDGIHRNITNASAAFRTNIQSYLDQSQTELFDTSDDCMDWARDAYDDLISGKVGGNILYQTMVKARLNLLPDTLELLELGLRDTLPADRTETADEIDALIAYFRATCIAVPFKKTLFQSTEFSSKYDVKRWRTDGYLYPLAHYRSETAKPFQTEVPEALRETVLSRVGTFGETPAGLSRLVRSWSAGTFRRNVTPIS
ncbi:B12-binding domain-containing radical SAM protein [Roseovarius sp. 2305UL8-3]|uniref:B12-binding domain-containing radical SAM protein n=1 Tax=Roseovarius conchicola TaxID=3121636 RepID=UPI00352856D8